MQQLPTRHEIACPRCRASGFAMFEELKSPGRPIASTARRVVTLPKGFSAGAIDSDGNQEVFCEKCGLVAPVEP